MQQQPARLSAVEARTFAKIWDDKKTGSKPFDASFFAPVAQEGFHCVAHFAQRTHSDSPTLRPRAFLLKECTGSAVELLKPPADYQLIWNDKRTGARFGDCSIWLPIAPEGYAALGCVVAPSYDKPKLTDIRCVHKSLCVEAGAVAEHDGHCLWKDLGSGARYGSVSIWSLAPLDKEKGILMDAFLAVPHHGDASSPASPFAFCGLYCLAKNAVTILSATDEKAAPPQTASPSWKACSPKVELKRSGLLPFGVDPDQLKIDYDEGSGCHVPAGLLTLKRLLYALEGHKEEGIFRLSGSNEDIKQLQDNLTNYKNLRKDGHIHFDFVPENVHSVANLIIRWYRALPGRIFEGSSIIQRMTEIDLKDIDKLPFLLQQPRRDLFKWVMEIAVDVILNQATTKMTANNLAVVLTPSLLPVSDNLVADMMLTNKAMPIINEYLIYRLRARQQ